MVFVLLYILVAGVGMTCLTHAHPEYADQIPNGYNVKDVNGNPWLGVGHERPGGSGPLNPFGTDFQAAGYTWTQDLCKKDSDGDGASNGQELGDPNCVWTPGATPASSIVSHPGFPGDVKGIVDTCKSWTSPVANTTTVNLEFSQPFNLPSGIVTSYVRQGFDMRNYTGNVDTYAYRFEVIYGGPVNVVHHIVLYQCQDASDIVGYTSPSTGDLTCYQGILYAWAIGGPVRQSKVNRSTRETNATSIRGIALHLSASTPYVMIEVHFNNADMTPGISAQPGLKILTVPMDGRPLPSPLPTLAWWMMLGASLDSVAIPPGRNYTELTVNFSVPIYSPPIVFNIWATLSHMHYLGRRIWVEVYNESSPARSVACNPFYDNENQEVIPADEPIVISSGDIVEIHCVYDSTNKTVTTYGGEQVQNPIISQTPAHITLTPQPTKTLCVGANTNAALIGDLTPVPTWIIIHASLAAFGMGFLLPLAATFPASRKFRAKGPKWFKLHWITMVIGVCCGWAAFGLGIANGTTIFSQHGQMGMALVALTIVQVSIGMLRPHLPHDPSQPKSNPRKAFEWVHPTVGWIIMGCIAVQLFWGYTLLQTYWDSVYLGNWKYVHAIAFFSLWAILMVTLHPPPFLQSKNLSENQLANKVGA